MQLRQIALGVSLAAAPGLLYGQFDFRVAGRQVQTHSFFSQSFLYSNQNNYLSMPTSKGTFAFTDGGANISTSLTDKLRVGAQLYIRNVGEMGNGRPTLDWAIIDYRAKSWFGIKGGRVKTTLGLFNDVQDMDSLHTFALLPEAIYPIDWRSTTIAHDGADVYGDISVRRLGTFSYTVYAGMRPQDFSSGYVNAFRTTGIRLTELGGPQAGGDIRWAMPFGVVVGASYLQQDITGHGTVGSGPYKQTQNLDATTQYFGQYTLKNFRIDAEYRRNLRDANLMWPTATIRSNIDSRGWYVAGTYHLNKWLDLGAYRSQYYVDKRKPTDPPSAHQFNTTVSARVNMKHGWYVKAEGKFFDGAPTTPAASRGFYTISNPTGIRPDMSLLVIRTGIAF